MSPSQAPLCHCALRPVTDRPEGTFRSLRYAFGGDHPSQTTRHAVSPHPRGLGPRHTKGRISTSAPGGLASPFHCLRPILHIACPDPTRSYSKGSRGLFVPSRVIGIFTDTTISLGSWSRQRPRAGAVIGDVVQDEAVDCHGSPLGCYVPECRRSAA